MNNRPFTFLELTVQYTCSPNTTKLDIASARAVVVLIFEDPASTLRTGPLRLLLANATEVAYS